MSTSVLEQVDMLETVLLAILISVFTSVLVTYFLVGRSVSKALQPSHKLTAKSVEAQEIKLVSNNGTVRAKLALDSQAQRSSLVLYDPDGKQRLVLTAGSDEVGLSFLDERGMPRVGLITYSDTGPTLEFLEDNGKVRASLSMHTGNPALKFGDKEGNDVIRLGIDELGAFLAFYKKSLKAHALLRSQRVADGGEMATLWMYGEQKAGAGLGVVGELPVLILADKDGNPYFSPMPKQGKSADEPATPISPPI